MSPNVESTQQIRARIARLARLDERTTLDEVVGRLHAKLAEAPSLLVCATLDDVTLSERRPNIPGADALRPNWSIPLPASLEEIMASPLAAELAESLDVAGGLDGDGR